ncbi:MAG TPA: bifunctional UDP-N-acetylglucosamine diphosphorylase/glucosamine-1-phosphate N-acetyltransferase GlmU [Propionibacteriaceae bacterium]|nr:bifunctional UDP-N-acetylglucosamine diphosphorylase/glucosamine-1-phosphate N-acetyltransferase GlmU [Propionibacteriaceae bacterium]
MSSEPAGVTAVVVLAAGGGTRMKSRRSKLLHELCGRSMLSYAITAATSLEPDHLVVVVGHEREQVSEHLAEIAPYAVQAVQEPQLGTGHAVRVGLDALDELPAEVVVTYGDVPLLTGETLAGLVAEHRAAANAVTVLTSVVDVPTGYGRVVREHGRVSRVVEEKDASDEERDIREINSGIYVFDAATLRDGLAELRTDNAQGEMYLTDVIAYANRLGRTVGAHLIDDPWQTQGVNDRVQLAALSKELNRRILERWMRDGVTVMDPATTWVADTVDLAEDVTLLPNTILRGATSVARGATLGPDTMLTDVEVGEDAHVVKCHATLSVIGDGAEVGPFSYLRPGTRLGVKGKIGAFVEAKNAVIGDGAKVPHLTYCGDAEVGEGANIGAGTIFANYDGVTKSRTTVGKASFVGSNSVLVAPVNIADGAYVAAGSAITEDVGPGQLAIGRSRQRNIDGWVASRRPGSTTHQAADEAIAARKGEQE